MGLLDDAIREHLELKRRNGADPSEVARQEREALGPARRGPEPLEVPPEPEPADPALVEPQVDAPVYREPEDVPEYEPPAPPPGELEPEPLAEAPPVEPDRSSAVPEEAEVDWEAPADPQPARDTDQPTVAFDAADIADAERRPAREPTEAPPPARDPGDEPPPAREPGDEPPPAREPPPREAEHDEDVLEETPDFLQETPEHDRLWFEQRPPRDFDFDG